MKNNRRLKRMGRSKKKIVTSLNLTSLMDVFTILVFFLLFHSASGNTLEAPKQIKLPDSFVEAKPRETLVIIISDEAVVVQGKEVVTTAELLEDGSGAVSVIAERLRNIQRSSMGITETTVESREVTILSDKKIPFKALKKIMSICTGTGYGKISLAVNQKSEQG